MTLEKLKCACDKAMKKLFAFDYEFSLRVYILIITHAVLDNKENASKLGKEIRGGFKEKGPLSS